MWLPKAMLGDYAETETSESPCSSKANAKYEIIEEENGYFVILKDNVGKEIAKSSKYDTFTAALITTPRGRAKEITDSIF